jgi:N-dimethylarginine dimethylaminohydrolase
VKTREEAEEAGRELPPESYHQTLFPPEAEPPFDEVSELEAVWGAAWGSVDEVSELRAVLMRPPGRELEQIRSDAWNSTVRALVDPDGRWYWTSERPPDLALVGEQYDGLVAALESEGVAVHFAEAIDSRFTKAMFTRDPLLSVPGGVIVGRMGPRMRRGEEASATRAAAAFGVPILRTIAGTGLLEGGSFAKLTPRVAAVGTSIRCNEEGARQLQEALRPVGIELLVVPLPGFSIHLDGHLAMVDRDKALVHAAGLPYWFLERLRELGIETIWSQPDERWAVNLLVLRPGKVLMPGDCPYSAESLERRGIEVVPLAYDEIQKNGGSIHCSTLELRRDRSN